MLVDLVQVTTRDGLRLEGMFQAAERPAAGPLDAVCLVHGTGGNFYTSSLFAEMSEHFRQRGIGVLRVNTRGHDGISTSATAQGGRRSGAAYEMVDDCRHDLAAWLDWLAERAGSRLGLIGHSLGAVKSLYALAQERHPAVAVVIGLSPPWLSYSVFCASEHAAEFLRSYQEAERLVSAGRPAALIEVPLPLPMAIAAGGFVEKYGPDERYNYLKFVRGVDCPTLITLGGLETAKHMAFRGAPEALREIAARRPKLGVELIADADHFYTGVRGELLSCIDRWLGKVRG